MENGIAEILEKQEHRPFPPPQKKCLLYQEWKDVLFVHSKADPKFISNLIPEKLEPDITAGSAWISVVIFNTPHTSLLVTPRIRVLPAYCELNLRTYVRYNGKPGIHFIDIKVNRKLPALVNRLFSLLPYNYAGLHCSDQHTRYFLNEHEGRNLVDIDFIPEKQIINKTYIDTWLTERYVAWQSQGRELYAYHIHHPAWNLFSVKTKYQVIRFQQPPLLLYHNDDLFVHFSPLQKALLWRRKKEP